MANSKFSDSCCSNGGDVVSDTLERVGINRSLLVTFALVPFAWDGVVWFGHAVNTLWGLVVNAVG